VAGSCGFAYHAMAGLTKQDCTLRLSPREVDVPNRAKDWIAQAERDLEGPRVAGGRPPRMGLFRRPSICGEGREGAPFP
jgi:hypothetical protein